MTITQLFRKVLRFVSDPFRLKELNAIRKQMDFWHAEEVRTMIAAFKAYDDGNHEGYAALWLQHLNARKRSKLEVSDKLETFNPAKR